MILNNNIFHFYLIKCKLISYFIPIIYTDIIYENRIFQYAVVICKSS